MFYLGSMCLVKELKTRPNIGENPVGRQGVALKGPTRSCHCASLKEQRKHCNMIVLCMSTLPFEAGREGFSLIVVI